MAPETSLFYSVLFFFFVFYCVVLSGIAPIFIYTSLWNDEK